ncbi:conjugal transfer protein TraI [Dyadobacter luteus]|uniref:Conjugal transfer protein TraI n=1 Tax=Dyadobacter luteus TaxID=2259619 RepID=A0A3D8YAP1_9BACT|nr:conjugal transfer protein TraI [Dyadobacter luteus]REA60170.1 conjugal transfer protein TraI [Dyadobacter luteus]
MRKHIRIFLLSIFIVAASAPMQRAEAAWWEVVRQVIIRVIKAIDLGIQRQQNKIVWLQNAQKALENTMAKLQLDQITEWTQKQRDLYKEYFDELQKVKSLITYYKRIRAISDKQYRLVLQYRRAWNLVQTDKHFTPGEVAYMGKVYTGILSESIKNIDQIAAVIKALQTSMTDAKRIELINDAAERTEKNYDDLMRFTNQNMLLSIQRSRSQQDVETIRLLYGIP